MRAFMVLPSLLAVLSACAYQSGSLNPQVPLHEDRVLFIHVQEGGGVDPESAADRQARLRAVVNLDLGRTLRLHSTLLGQQEGQLLIATADTLYLSTATGDIHVPVESVEALWVRGKSKGRGAVIGGLIGGIGFGAFLSALSGFCEYDCENAARDGAFAGFIVGGVGGSGIGALIGAAITKWHLRYKSTP